MSEQAAASEVLSACVLCGTSAVSEARIAIGYTHCTSKGCVAEWRRRRIETADLQLVKVHKQGPMWIKRSDLKDNNMKRTGR